MIHALYRLGTWLVVGSVLASGAGCVQLYENPKYIAAGVEYWFPDLEGDISRTSGLLANEKIDVKDDLDLNDEDAPVIRAMGQLGPVVLDVNYFGLDYDGSSEITRTIDFNGLSFTIGAPVESDIDLDYVSLKAKFGLIRLGPVAAGPIVGVNYFDLDVKLESTVGRASDRIDSPFPVVGAIVTFDQTLGNESFSIFADAEISGFAVDDQFDLDGHFLDAQGRAGFRFWLLRFGGGYRWIDADIEDTGSDFEADLSLSGPFVFGELSW